MSYAKNHSYHAQIISFWHVGGRWWLFSSLGVLLRLKMHFRTTHMLLVYQVILWRQPPLSENAVLPFAKIPKHLPPAFLYSQTSIIHTDDPYVFFDSYVSAAIPYAHPIYRQRLVLFQCWDCPMLY